MATSLSTTQSIVTTGGTFNTGGSASASFKLSDYGQSGLGTVDDLNRFLTQLNPLTQQIQALSTGVNINGLDGGIFSLKLPLFQSDWTAITLGAGAVFATDPGTLVTFAGTNVNNCWRKDQDGVVWLRWSVNAAPATLYTLPQPLWPLGPIQQGAITVSAAGVVAITGAVGSYGLASWPCANLSAGQIPIFPLYLKVAQGRTPAACVLLGVKPTTNQTLSSIATGVICGPNSLTWSWLSNTAPLDTTSSGQKINTVRIDSITGLTYNQAYIATVLVLYGTTGQSTGA